MNFRLLSVSVLLLVFVTTVACSFAESFLPEMEPSYEVWAVDNLALLAMVLVDSYTYGMGKISF